jgi:hypothetical protein
MTKQIKAKESFVHSYRPEYVFKGDFIARPIEVFMELTHADNRTRRYIPDSLIAGGDSTSESEMMAAALLLRHPIVQEQGCSFVTFSVENCPQGVFELTDKNGHDWIYALRTARTPDSKEIKVLYALSSDFGTSFGIFNTTETSNGKLKVRGKAKPVTRQSLLNKLDEIILSRYDDAPNQYDPREHRPARLNSF